MDFGIWDGFEGIGGELREEEMCRVLRGWSIGTSRAQFMVYSRAAHVFFSHNDLSICNEGMLTSQLTQNACTDACCEKFKARTAAFYN